LVLPPYYLQLFAIIATICLQKVLLLFAIIAPSSKTLIIAIIGKLLLQLIFSAINYWHYWH